MFLKLAKSCNFDSRHTKHITVLALKIFDDLKDLHQFGQKEKYYLLCAGLLHDIGVHTEGPKDHHKTGLKIILDSPILQFDNKTRFIIGSIARYHRGALPSIEHDHFRVLGRDEKKMVSILAGILRLTDGLDYSHKNRIRDIRTSYTKKKIHFDCLSNKSLTSNKEISSALNKGDLLRRCLKRDLMFTILSTQKFK